MMDTLKIYRRSRNGYMMAADGSYEHRDVWTAAHGPIPSNCHIHHKNRVRHDNRLENLECMEAEAHLRLHGLTWKMVNHLRRIREARPLRKFQCVVCGTEHQSKHPLARFCSPRCVRQHHNGILGDKRSVERAAVRGSGVCGVCGDAFTRTRKDQIYCSRRCAHVSAKRRLNARLGHVPTPASYRV
jgi:transcription elongation factor Elf1